MSVVNRYLILTVLVLTACNSSVSPQQKEAFPKITRGPVTTTAIVGKSATFSVTVIGENLSFQWYKNGNVIQNANKSVYTIMQVTNADDGARFSVRVNNSVGVETSTEARLWINGSEDFNQNEGRKGGFLLGSYAKGGQPLSLNWTRQSSFVGPATDNNFRAKSLVVKNTNLVRSPANSYSTPIIAPDGTVFVSAMNIVYAFAPDGTQKSQLKLQDGEIISKMTLASDGTLYGSTDRHIIAIDTSNQIVKWRYAADYVKNAPVLDAMGNLYFIQFDGQRTALTSLTPKGEHRWDYLEGSYLDIFKSSVILGQDKTLYFGDGEGYLHAVSTDGKPKWSRQINATSDIKVLTGISSTPVIDDQNILYIGTHDGKIIAVDTQTTNTKWIINLKNLLTKSDISLRGFALGRDGYLYATGVENTTGSLLLRIDRSAGDIKAIFSISNSEGTSPFEFNSVTPPLVDADGRVFVGTARSGVHTFVGNNELGTYSENPPFFMGHHSDLALGSNGMLYFTGSDSEGLGQSGQTFLRSLSSPNQ